MPSNYALAKDCQLLRKDVEGVLTLSAQLLLSSSPDSYTSAATVDPSSGASSSSRLQAGPLISAVLTEASTRSLLLNTLVRVYVPAQRQTALLHDNRYVQLANEAAKKRQRERQQQQNESTNHKDSATNKMTGSASMSVEQQQYRVGRIVGVVPKPAAKSPSSSSATEPSQRWLLAVYVGECVEPFTLSSLSDEPFTETEHRIFVQSALSTNRDDGSRRSNVLPSQQPVLLSAEMATTVQQNIKDMRRVLEVVDAVQTNTGDDPSVVSAVAAKVDAFKADVLQRASGVKRPRDGDDALLGVPTTSPTTANNAMGISDENAPPSLGAFIGHGAISQATRLAKLADDVAARNQQLQQLRQLLQQKDHEVKSALQQQQQMEARHRGEVDVWRAKAEEQSRAQQRAANDAAESLMQRDRLLEEANTKLRRLAGMTTKYKQVVDTVAAMLKRGSSSGESGGKSMSPDEILGALQHKSLV